MCFHIYRFKCLFYLLLSQIPVQPVHWYLNLRFLIGVLRSSFKLLIFVLRMFIYLWGDLCWRYKVRRKKVNVLNLIIISIQYIKLISFTLKSVPITYLVPLWLWFQDRRLVSLLAMTPSPLLYLMEKQRTQLRAVVMETPQSPKAGLSYGTAYLYTTCTSLCFQSTASRPHLQ